MADEPAAPITAEDFLIPAEGEEEGALSADTQADAGDDLEQIDVTDLPLEADEGEEQTDDAELLEEQPEALPMPVSWSKEDTEAWKALPAETQAVIARREADRDKYVRETGRKAAETRHTVEQEARQIIAQQAEQAAATLRAYAAQFMPQEPDQRLLYTGNQDDVLTYQRQDAAYRAATAQQHQLHQEVARSQQQATEARTQADQAEIAVDAQRLKEQLPEWFDPSAGPELRQSLQSIGAELGYPAELMAQAGSNDILALKKAAEWKAKADKFDTLISKKMSAVRAAKELPKMARPGVTQGKSAQGRQSQNRREQAFESFAQTRSGAAAAALLLERKR